MSPLPEQDQDLDLASSAAPDHLPTAEAEVVRLSSRPDNGARLDLSVEEPTPSATVLRQGDAEVNLNFEVPRFGKLSIDGCGPAITAATAYLLIVASATVSAVAVASLPSMENSRFVAWAVFLIVLVLGVCGHKKFR